jgi:copper chaperone CopZ
VRSALLEIDGVTRVQVSLERGDVIVTYDASKTKVEALIVALEAATGPQSPKQYQASIKEAPTPVPSGP